MKCTQADLFQAHSPDVESPSANGLPWSVAGTEAPGEQALMRNHRVTSLLLTMCHSKKDTAILGEMTISRFNHCRRTLPGCRSPDQSGRGCSGAPPLPLNAMVACRRHPSLTPNDRSG